MNDPNPMATKKKELDQQTAQDAARVSASVRANPNPSDPTASRQKEFTDQAAADAERRQRPAHANPDPAPASRQTTAEALQRSRDQAGEGNGEP
jgi:hypothetical protein